MYSWKTPTMCHNCLEELEVNKPPSHSGRLSIVLVEQQLM